MQFIQRLLKVRAPSELHAQAASRAPVTLQQDSARCEVAKMAMKDVLKKHGIPTGWITCEVVAGHRQDRVRGTHLRLVVREWRPALLPYTVSIQRAILARLTRIDPLAPDWFAGVSWRYALVDDSTCPPLPPSPHIWDDKQAQDGIRPRGPDLLEVQSDAGSRRRSHESTEFAATQPM